MRCVVYNGSREIYLDMVSAVKSLLAHTEVDAVYLLIEDDVFPYELPEIVQTINVSELIPKLFDIHGPNYHSEWTPVGLIRFALTKVFPEYDVVLAIDADTIVIQDIGDLFELEMADYYFAAAREPYLTQVTGYMYCNAGVMLCNNRLLIQTGMDDVLINEINTRYLRFVGQDAMSSLFRGKIKELSSEYNSCKFTLPTDKPKVLHFANDRTWLNSDLTLYYRELPCKTLQKDSMTEEDGESAENLSSASGRVLTEVSVNAAIRDLGT